ncbi:protein-cysteine N-palmitoyltransferase Rasp-like [Culicoides brevitarsis]|uniref:protein-cysteine N-palmitoyltransferase Rasp-like n=1 Tax=Culicoides brevitarsis TaxID=469753 RepID=UPI00307C6037
MPFANVSTFEVISCFVISLLAFVTSMTNVYLEGANSTTIDATLPCATIVIAISLNCLGIIFLAKKVKRESLIWTWTVLHLILLRLPSTFETLMSHTDDRARSHNLLMMLSWNVLRCNSLGIDAIHQNFELLRAFSYIFYLPTLISGPIVNYGDFRIMEIRATKRYFSLTLGIVRCLFVAALVEIWQHLFRSSHFEEHYNRWTLYGVCLSQAATFYGLHRFMFGLSIEIGTFHGIQMPNVPRCIFRISSVREQARYFDNGMHKFLSKYIYRRSSSQTFLAKSKNVAVTSLFVILWHGIERHVLLWVVVNYILMHCEKGIDHLLKQKFIKNQSASNQARLKAIIGANLWIPSMLSNFTLLTGFEIGIKFFEKTYLMPSAYLTLMSCMYCLHIVVQKVS